MGNERQIIFEPFRLDSANECLWKGSQAIKLRPKAFAVLDYLLGRPGQLVTKEELLQAVWQGTFVGEAVLKVAIRQIREALDDDPKSPRFIETAHRRGYRFIGQISGTIGTPASNAEVRNDSASNLQSYFGDTLRGVVGRERALSRLRGWLDRMLGGERQIVFVTGEAGIGKTALVDMFTRSIASDSEIRIGRGQCLEQYGTGEAYLPILEAIGRLGREHREVVDVLRALAPMWLLQMPSLLSVSDRERLSRDALGATRERMLREMGEALETLTATHPLVLILEDLHWSDYSTLDLISYLARQRQFAKLMLIGTYRTVELIVSGHPLKAVKRELLAKQQCEELPVEYLSRVTVAEYLSVRFPINRFPIELAALIHDRTDGNPLFMVNAVDYLVAEGLIDEDAEGWKLDVDIGNVEVGVPESIKQLIEKQVDHLDDDEQRTLEAASVAGVEFSTLAVAAGLGEDQIAVEARCDDLARQHQFIQACGLQVLPNGEAATRYGFIHALYQNVLYDRTSTSRRAHLHRRIGERGEAVYGERAREIAAELAMHFERGANYGLAVNYLQQAADNDLRRFAYQEAVVLSRRALELLERVPDTPERSRQELSLHIALGVPLIATEGYAASSAGAAYTRARELCRELGATPELSQVLWGLWTFHLVRAELGRAREIAEEFLRLREPLPYARLAMEVTLMHLGEFVPSIEHFQQALALYNSEQHRDAALRYAQNPAVASQCHAAWALWFLGQPDQALERIEQALSLARELGEPHGLAHTLFFAAILHQLRRENRMARQRSEAAMVIANEHGLALYQATSTVARGWALIEQSQNEEAIELIRQGLAAHRATGTELLRPHFLALLAEAFDQAGQFEQALEVLEEALAVAHVDGERYYQAELYRLKGEVLLQQHARRAASRTFPVVTPADRAGSLAAGNAIGCLNQALQIARQQQARSFELRAAMSLGRFYQSQGRKQEAQQLISQTYEKFREGFETKDLQEAKALLDGLASG